ncbi:hypothetical protein A3I95_00070 [Candidatus Nomurabacteria bacterium RIFCSPLOWO2_02_FULL_44_12]|nr:MAG: hypothetical protein A3I95_00070 [Candidatus Nomurabacteria bacterium RIFCSPLOWO2_02_FULL_44_12]
MLELINSLWLRVFLIFFLVLFILVFFFSESLVGFFLSYLLLYKYTTLFIIVFLAGFCVPIPINILLMAVGALSLEGNFNFYLALVTGSIANLLGDVAALFIFRRYGHAILRDKFVQKYSFFIRLERFFERHVNISIFVSRIIGIFGTPVNFLSGYLKISITRFVIFDYIGNFVFEILRYPERKLTGVKYSFFIRLERFFERHVNISIFVSRIIGIFGTPVNFLSGYLKISITRFVIFDYIGNFVFVYLFLSIGALVGDRWLAASDFVNAAMNVIAVILLVSIITLLYKTRNNNHTIKA